MQPINHYVPRFLLKNFCVGKKPRLWVFDKKTGSVFHAHIQKVAGERRFYDLEVGDTTVSLEEPLAQIEGKTSKIIRRVIEAKNLKVLTTSDRATIALFVALQMLRVPHQREHLLAFDRVLRESLEERGIDIFPCAPQEAAILEHGCPAAGPAPEKRAALRSLTAVDIK